VWPSTEVLPDRGTVIKIFYALLGAELPFWQALAPARGKLCREYTYYMLFL
jgi:hypothetical protein